MKKRDVVIKNINSVLTSKQRRFMPSFAVLRSFECAARHQSFTLAAEELSLTQSAISRQIKELELAIGVDLFRRVGRRVELSERGAVFAADLRLDLERIKSTVFQAITADDDETVLRIAVLPTFASRWLIPRLSEFGALHPDIQIHLSVRENTFNLIREHFDAALHFGPAVWPDGDLAKLCTEVMVPVASPSLIASHGIFEAKDLLDAPLIHLESRPLAWNGWFSAVGMEELGVLGGKQYGQFSMVIAGAIASLGAAILPSYLIEAELADGRLQRISEVGLSTNNAYYIATPTGIRNPGVKAFSKWVKGQISNPLNDE